MSEYQNLNSELRIPLELGAGVGPVVGWVEDFFDHAAAHFVGISL